MPRFYLTAVAAAVMAATVNAASFFLFQLPTAVFGTFKIQVRWRAFCEVQLTSLDSIDMPIG